MCQTSSVKTSETENKGSVFSKAAVSDKDNTRQLRLIGGAMKFLFCPRNEWIGAQNTKLES